MMRRTALAFFMLTLMVGCVSAQVTEPAVQIADHGMTEPPSAAPPTATFPPLPTVTFVPTPVTPSPTSTPGATLTAANGNIYIRRGPGLLYNQIAVLYKDTSAVIIGQDVLSRWVQVRLPNSDITGWVSLQTGFTRVEGDLNYVPNFTFNDWPQPAYVVNCTEHPIVVEPGDFYLYNLFTHSFGLNRTQLNPGTYTAYDMLLPDTPELKTFHIREGVTVYITVNGLGVSHNCP